MKRKFAGFLLFLTLLFAFDQVSAQNQKNKPNIVIILADDMGYGDVSALNKNAKTQTPHIDALIKPVLILRMLTRVARYVRHHDMGCLPAAIISGSQSTMNFWATCNRSSIRGAKPSAR